MRLIIVQTLNKPINICVFNKPIRFYMLFLANKYLRMFKMLDLSKELKSTEKSCIFPLKGTSLDSVAPDPLDMFHRQN